MNKSDLKHGNVVELRNGDKLLLCWHFVDSILVDLEGRNFITLDTYHEDLTSIDGIADLDIMKVYQDYTCKKLLWERKEKPKLTEDEKIILKNIPKKYKYIARDKSGLIFLCSKKPSKCDYSWIGYNDIAFPYDHLFQFIKWEDEEPYSIENLLKGEEK